MKIKLKTSNVFFISDSHFSHKNIIEYDKRPFGSVDEHDEAIIENWNKVVGKDDYVFHLGDFSFSNPGEFYKKLNGRKTILKGNHDHKKCPEFDFVDYVELNIMGQSLYLFHYPIAEWNKAHHGSYHIHGHTHGNSWYDKEFGGKYKVMNVGVNLIDYTPISYEAIHEKLKDRQNIIHH